MTCFILIWIYLNICSGSDLSDMQCMFQKDETHLWVAGHQGLMVDVDLRKGVISKTVMRWNRLLFILLLNMPFCTKCHHDKNVLSIWWIFLNLFDWQNSVTSMLFLTYWRQYSFFFYKIEVDPGTVVMKQSNRYLCCGDTSGKVCSKPYSKTYS